MYKLTGKLFAFQVNLMGSSPITCTMDLIWTTLSLFDFVDHIGRLYWCVDYHYLWMNNKVMYIDNVNIRIDPEEYTYNHLPWHPKWKTKLIANILIIASFGLANAFIAGLIIK